MVILHISFDYPDKIDGKKTKAVKNLVNSQTETKNIIFSLNRTATKLDKMSVLKEEHGYTLYVWGLPFGILLHFWMYVAYKRILKVIEKDGIKPDLIHAHKLASEGIIASFLSNTLKVPFICSIRSSDLHVLRYKRGYHRIYRKVLKQAAQLIFISPWAVQSLKYYLGEDSIKENYQVLPNIINLSYRNGSIPAFNKKFVTVSHLKYLKAKNIERTIKAFDIIFDKYPGYTLDIVGDGPRRGEVIEMLAKTRNPRNFVMKGEIENSVLISSYADYQGMVLPSFPETFGMVFIEALSAGIPIIYSKNSGIDGYFDNFKVGLAVNYRSVKEIAGAISKIIEENIAYKRGVEEMVKSGYLHNFSQPVISERYARILSNIKNLNLTNKN